MLLWILPKKNILQGDIQMGPGKQTLAEEKGVPCRLISYTMCPSAFVRECTEPFFPPFLYTTHVCWLGRPCVAYPL